MGEVFEKLQRCYRGVREKSSFKPQAALVLGSGLGGFAERIQTETVIDYREIEGFPVSTAAGHKGRFVLGYIRDVPVVCMQGRVHYYEGYSMQDVVLPIRLMGLMGAQRLLLTNAAGGIKEGMQPGDLMAITGQIASFVPSPLNGPNVDELGVRFPDMSRIYDKGLLEMVCAAAGECGIALKKGVYLQMAGPQYESPQEIAMCRILGADAVGMSTACEAVAARHMGMEVAGISCISNLAAGISPVPLSHDEVKRAADKVADKFGQLVWRVILGMAE